MASFVRNGNEGWLRGIRCNLEMAAVLCCSSTDRSIKLFSTGFLAQMNINITEGALKLYNVEVLSLVLSMSKLLLFLLLLNFPDGSPGWSGLGFTLLTGEEVWVK